MSNFLIQNYFCWQDNYRVKFLKYWPKGHGMVWPKTFYAVKFRNKHKIP